MTALDDTPGAWNESDWSDNANPTRTTTAATIAARINTRYRLRMSLLPYLARQFPNAYQLQVVCRVHRTVAGEAPNRGNAVAPRNCASSTPLTFAIARRRSRNAGETWNDFSQTGTFLDH
jgi:hypothetical protein